jgi:hypothetical protein
MGDEMKRFLPLLLIIGVVIVSGCVSQGKGGGGTNGIIIESFSPAISEVEPREEVDVTALIKNVGGAKTTNIQAQLLGLTDEWGFNPGRSQSIGDLLPPDADRGIEGEEEELIWYLTPPSKQVTLPYEMELRVYYNYETSSVSQIRVATRNYIGSFPTDQQEAERNKLGVRVQQASSGPISINVIARSKVIDNPGENLSVTVDVQNVGGGTADNDRVGISVSSDRSVSCTGIEGGQITLSRGKSRQIRCTINTGGIPANGWGEIPLTINLNYRYWVSSVSTITVLAQEVR